MRDVVTRFDPAPGSLPHDDRWPRAGHWLAAGPGPNTPDVAVLGVPAFARSLRRSGAHATPAAVRRALHHFTTWCASRHVDVADLWPWDAGDVAEPDGDDGEWRTQSAVRTAIAKAGVLVAVGGDGSITFPVVTAAHDLTTAGLLAIDAALDLRDGVGNESSLRRLIDIGLDPTRIAVVGAADWATSRSHSDEAKARGVHVVARSSVHERGMAACMDDALAVVAGQAASVHVSFDLSACDRGAVPACLDAVPAGLSAADVLVAAFVAGRNPQVRSIDIVDVDATADADDQRSVRLAAMLVLEFAAGLVLRPTG